MAIITPEELDQLLPQTQCSLCGYGGCMPYAEAMVYEKAAINLCTPGGVQTLKNLGQKLEIDVEPYMLEMEQKTKAPTLAFIREAECIGCTKCIQVCPVDAIIGSAKHMHTVIDSDCTGCDLCVPACPVDCIDLHPSTPLSAEAKESARKHYARREARLLEEKHQKSQRLQQQSLQKRRDYIKEAIKRSKEKRHLFTSPLVGEVAPATSAGQAQTADEEAF